MYNRSPFLMVLILAFIFLDFSQGFGRDCERPPVFENLQILREYITCLKTLVSDQRYGKRSDQDHIPLMKKLLPNFT
ncbi:hypothetical protein JTB14_001136 [Gonioctena quinquepunctata]|nr:hypothetical protein JTB14_001136 [Gonioctena quinquepunctata]